MQETGCLPATSVTKLRSESIGFSEIPGQSSLFLQYQSDPLSLRKYYPTAVASHGEVAGRANEVLNAYTTDRDKLCQILTDQNVRFGAGEQTFKNIERLRQSNTVAVVTGQQAGILTGPLYTLYKALTAVKLSYELNSRGVSSVPVFWIATEDHDFEEISEATILGVDGDEIKLQLTQPADTVGNPVGSIKLTPEFAESLKTYDLCAELGEIWEPGTTIGEAFAKHLQYMCREFGLIMIDPLDPLVKRLSAPVYAEAARHSNAITDALLARSSELIADGFHAQVLITPDYFPLFYHTEDGVRRAVRKGGQRYHVAGTKLEFSLDDLVEQASSAPERFSPNVMLRSVVQDYLFPTICYLGGGAEVAYFAQSSEVYRLLDRPVTTILHRQSFTIIEPKHARTLEKFALKFTDLFAGLDALLPRIVDEFVNPPTARLFADTEDKIGIELNRLDQELSQIDPTLAANLATRRRKIMYHITALRTKFRRLQIRRDAEVDRRIGGLFASVLPNGTLQERTLNVTTFTELYAEAFISWVYDSLDLSERGHKLLYM